MADQSTCLSPACGYSVEGNLRKCPKCGWAMRGPGNIRVRGWALLGLGSFLVLFMGAITWFVASLMPQAGKKEGGGMIFTGTSQEAEIIFGLFGLVILFGIFSIVNGGYMVARGRPNRPFALGTLAIAVLLIGLGWAINNELVL